MAATLHRRFIVVGVAASGFVAPVSQHWTLTAANRCCDFYQRLSGGSDTFHVVRRGER